MTDSPPLGRHRGHRRAPRRRRGLIGPVVSALSVLLAIGPVVWLMHNGSASAENHPTDALNVSDDSGPAAVEGTSLGGKPSITITKTLPDGRTTTLVGPAILGPAASTGPDSASNAPTSASPGTTTTGGQTQGPGTTTGQVTQPTEGVTTVTVPPGRTTAGHPGRPLPSRPTLSQSRPTKPTTRPTRTPTTTEPTEEPSQPPVSGGGTSAEEREVVDLTNAVRREAGCGPVRLDDSLVEAAGRHASDMVRRQYMSHKNPENEGPGDRMARAGYRGSGWGENIAAGHSSARRVVQAWMNSEGHRKNILNCRFNRIGVGFDPGRVKPDWGPGSWVQDFGRSS